MKSFSIPGFLFFFGCGFFPFSAAIIGTMLYYIFGHYKSIQYFPSVSRMNSFSPQWYVFKIFNTIGGFLYIICILLKEHYEKLSFGSHHQTKFLIFLQIIKYSSFSTSFGIIGLSFVSLTMNHDLHHCFAIIYFVSNLIGLVVTDLFNLTYKQHSNRSIVFTYLACFFAVCFYFSPWISHSNIVESFSNICEHLTITILALKVMVLAFQFPNARIVVTIADEKQNRQIYKPSNCMNLRQLVDSFLSRKQSKFIINFLSYFTKLKTLIDFKPAHLLKQYSFYISFIPSISNNKLIKKLAKQNK
jgi:hypothetical protein